MLALLAPIAYASPPDPSWGHGLYDGADFDDVVLVITAVAGIVELTPLADLSLAAPLAIWYVHYSDRPFRPNHPAVSTRALRPPGSFGFSR